MGTPEAGPDAAPVEPSVLDELVELPPHAAMNAASPVAAPRAHRPTGHSQELLALDIVTGKLSDYAIDRLAGLWAAWNRSCGSFG